MPFLEQGNNTDDSSHDQYKNVPLREQDRFLPIANIAKIMKKAIPDNGKVLPVSFLCYNCYLFLYTYKNIFFISDCKRR